MGQNSATITTNTICNSIAPELMFENKSISHTGNALLLEGIVDGRRCCMTIDTGSDNYHCKT